MMGNVPARNVCHYFGLSPPRLGFCYVMGNMAFTQLQFEMLEVSAFIVTHNILLYHIMWKIPSEFSPLCEIVWPLVMLLFAKMVYAFVV
jgi:hypothetical protein